jgi:putative endonuclease
MNILGKFKLGFARKATPEHLRRGRAGERAAKAHLRRQGLKFLTANFRSDRGEIDLIFRDRASSLTAGWCSRRLGFLSFPLLRACDALGILPKRWRTWHRQVEAGGPGCLVFIEVKTRSSEHWGRPASAVDAERRGRLTRAGLDYLRLLGNPAVKVRFDIVEVLLEDGEVREVRHLVNAFAMERPYRYG